MRRQASQAAELDVVHLRAVTLPPSGASEKLIDPPPKLHLKITIAGEFQASDISGRSCRLVGIARLNLLCVVIGGIQHNSAPTGPDGFDWWSARPSLFGNNAVVNNKSNLCLQPASKREVERDDLLILILWLVRTPKKQH